MCDHQLLIEKYAEHRKIHENFLQMFANLLETALNMQTLASDVTRSYDDILKQLQAETSSPLPSHKRRKAHSLESPATTVRLDDSSAARNKSDTDVSNSILNQNINLPDSEESFFVATQSPGRDPLSPKGSPCPANNIQQTPPRNSWFKTTHVIEEGEQKKQAESEKRKKKSSLSLGRFSTSFKMSPETSKQIEHLPVRQKMTTPKPSASGILDQQENIAPVGRWTAKKSTSGSLVKADSFLRKTPTSCQKEHSLLNRTRLRQTKLRFPDNLNKSVAADDDETYFDEFVVPSPTSFSGSRFLKSAKKKEQSSLVSSELKSPSGETHAGAKPNEDDFDIDQTYFSEAEKDLTRPGVVIPSVASTGSVSKIKQEPLTQKKAPGVEIKAQVLAQETQSYPDFDKSVLLVKPPSQEEVITIAETQPNKNDLFMEAIREERRKEQESRQSVFNVMGPVRQQIKQESSIHVKKDLMALGKISVSKTSIERRCIECSKHYQFLQNCGHAPDVIRGKLPRNCRECRNAQLHETPIGFWNPEFSPTQ